MGIKTRHQGEQHIVLKNLGTQAAATFLDHARALFDGYIANIWAEVQSAGVTGNQVVDVNLNGTTIFDAAGKITFDAATDVDSYSDLATQAVSKGDQLSIDVDEVHSGTPAEDLEVHIVLVERDPGDATNLAPGSLPRHF